MLLAFMALSACGDASDPNAQAGGDLIAEGKALFEAKGCIGCHGPGGTALIALDLYTREELRGLIQAPATEMMPAFQLTDEEADRITAYLRATYR